MVDLCCVFGPLFKSCSKLGAPRSNTWWIRKGVYLNASERMRMCQRGRFVACERRMEDGGRFETGRVDVRGYAVHDSMCH